MFSGSYEWQTCHKTNLDEYCLAQNVTFNLTAKHGQDIHMVFEH
jgi:hypothetical protein